MRLRRVLTALVGVATVVVTAVVLLAPPASAATLTEVTGFGTNPSNLRMFLYVPANVTARPAVVVAVHYCHGDGPAFFNGSDFGRLADQYGFIVIFPSVTQASDGCFDVATSATLTHNGGSDSLGIVSMVNYVKTRYNADSNRVYATGVSSGAMMTNVLLGSYPDVFKAGSAFAGVPFGCFAANPDALRWSDDCAKGRVVRTAQQWGDGVRAAFPGYTGARPRMQLWHGTNDEVLSYVNFGEAIKQWTNVLGVSQTPTSTEPNTPQSGWTRTRYAGSGGIVQVEAISMQGVPHNLPVQAAAAIRFFGLDTVAPTSVPPTSVAPTTSRPPTSAPPTTSRPPTTSPAPIGGCAAAYSIGSSWSGGFVATVRVTAGSAGTNGWRVALTLPTGTTITNMWNGQPSGTSGAVTVTNMAYNGRLGAGQATEFGFQGGGVGTGVTVGCTAT